MQMLLENRYRVLRTLGSGGFGETFLAEDTQMPSNRCCVIKQLKPIQNNIQIYQLVQERFQREAAILEDLSGSTDQIPSLYAYFQSEGQFYVVQEWVEGDTLAAKIQQQGLLSESVVREILVNLLPVLKYVHSKRIVHRDIKPDNIILRHRDGKPVLIDFGAVRESMGTVVNSQGLPTSSIVIGTPGYMPSEQAAGRPVYSSDLYSLGMTVIYLLTGRQPHELETDPRTGEIVWHQHALNVSPTLAMVIDRAIAYHPRDRYPTATEMLEALQNVPPSVATPQNTISVSPPASTQPTNQSNGQRGIFVGSLIVGGLIGAAVIIGLATNNQQQQLVAQSTPVSSEQATISSEPQNTPPVISPQPTPSVPSFSPTELSSQTPTAELPTSTPTQANKPYLGIQMVTLTPEIKEKINNKLGDRINLTTDNGVLLVDIVPRSPASIGGLQAGDVIRSINNQTVTKFEEVIKLVEQSTIGSPLPIEVERNGQLFKVTVSPTSSPAKLPISTSTQADKPYLGIQMVTLTPEVKEKINNQPGNHINITIDNGVLLIQIVPGSPASIAGLRPGDAIRSINNQPVTTTEEVIKLVEKSTIGSPLPIEVERNGQLFKGTVSPTSLPVQSEPSQTNRPSP
ncbi:PDZ domain-containing protein [Nostocaceae cyanobacterium CENA369]|uniref:non-specific serine/threonine protein kinase n=1 Tax=Dendronalium phyllosphericum CENA369 TaxID=1725256 RepID=A0A8J7LDY8_9NOST|nr:PDZ domain-containing protein [Dendronalium phyllosphericum]MBH8572239.1 PDZ domain-containing protein [Dendronalium phyllosphericum CENA369]